MFISSRIIRIFREIIIFQIFTLEAHCSKDKISIWSAVALSFFWFHRHGNERFIKNTDIEYFVWTFVMFDFGQVRVKSNRVIARKCFNIGKKRLCDLNNVMNEMTRNISGRHIFIGSKSYHRRALSVPESLVEFCSNCWNCQNWYMDFSIFLPWKPDFFFG